MFPSLKNLSIKSKLNVLVLVVSGAALLLTSAALIVNDATLIRDSKVQQLSALAEVLGANSTATLTFDDPAAAREMLSSLSLQPTVRFACLYDAKGRVFATYRGPGGEDFSPPPPGSDGHEFVAGNYLDVTHEMIRDGGKIGTVYFHASMDDLSAQLRRSVTIVAIVMLVSLGIAFLLSSRLQRIVSAPIIQLAQSARKISADRDYSIRVQKCANDEMGMLYDDFNAMLDQIQQGAKELQQAHADLEARVEQRTQQLSQANLELTREVAERKRAEHELESVHQQFVGAARRAGMAEVATGVLHNVGNVLNSVNVSAILVTDCLRRSKVADLSRALDLMNHDAADLARFLTKDEKGKHLPKFLNLVASHLAHDQSQLLSEMQSLTKNVDHVKTIVAMQQSYARAGGLVETVDLTSLVDDALKLNASSLGRYDIALVREYADTPHVRVDKQKVLQILVNLVSNARDALTESGRKDRRLVVRVRIGGDAREERIFIDVIDNGVGIAKENLTRIFSHGFTTKKEGHGFGLHSSANAAKELGGSLTAHSDGPECGAVLTLELPFKPVEVPHERA
ncbi:MAG: ATP-binding protein [Thermoguttaceae bacterium]|jgi:signal transduction histidine kinase